MLKRRRTHDDDDEIVQDGQVLRVPLTMMDSMDPVQKAVARSGVRVTDGSGKGGLNLHRPGFRLDARKTTTVRDPRGRLKETWETEEEEEDGISDAALRARDAAYRDYENQLLNAYKGKHDAASVEESVCPDCSGSGEINGQPCRRCEGTGEIDEDEPDTSDHRSIGQRMRDHQTRMDKLYEGYDQQICDAWRKG
jgi:hypothetical protein